MSYRAIERRLLDAYQEKSLYPEGQRPQEPLAQPQITVEGTVYKNSMLAFNLTSEWYRAKEWGVEYSLTFRDNAHYYAVETYIKGRAAVFEYNVVDSRLTYPKTDIDAIKSFAKPIDDISRPGWLRERDRKDLEVIERITEDLPNAKPMESVWIAASPAIPDTDVPYDERKRWGYGRHNFLFLHQLQIDPTTGQKRLVCRALRNYLTPEGQRKLVENLSGKPIPNDSDLHGYVARLSLQEMPRHFAVQDSMNIAHIHSVGEDVAKKMGENYWLHEDSMATGDAEKNEVRIMQQLSKLDWWLDDIYGDIMRLEARPSLDSLHSIERKFKGWEKAVSKIANGEKLKDELLTYKPQKWTNQVYRTSIDQNDPRVALILASMNMQGGIGTCGVGSGFGNINAGYQDKIFAGEVAGYGIHAVMSAYSGVAVGVSGGEYRKETSTNYESYKCPHCNYWLTGESKTDKKNWRDICDRCKKPVKCQDKKQ